MNASTKQKRFFIIHLLLVGLFILSLATGKYPLQLKAILAGETSALKVFTTLRLPRSIVALIGGFGLGMMGMVFQNVFKNPLASPDIIGVASGASAGAAFAIIFLPSSYFYRTGSAFLGSLIAVACALLLSSIVPHKKNISVVLSGVAIHSLAQTVLMFLKIVADPERELASIEYWIMGSLNGITLRHLPVFLLCTILGCILLTLLYRQVLLLSMEEDEAAVLGVNVAQMRLFILFVATLVVASIISVTGLVSFISLVAPHIARLITKNHRQETLLLSGLLGANLLLVADILARSLTVSELPISIFTSLLGAPFLMMLLMKRGMEDA